MTGENDFDRIFGGRPQTRPPQPERGSFAERVGRAAPEAPAPEPAATSAASPYKAFGFLPTNTVGETCEVARWVDGTEVPEGLVFQYRFLMEVGFVGEHMLKLFLPDCIVVVTGRKLHELKQKLGRRQVTFIQQHSAKVWPQPVPESETLIERIDILRGDGRVKRGGSQT